LKYVLMKPETLQWLQDKHAVSPEDTYINTIDGTPDDTELPPVPCLDGIDDDLVWIWRCREMGMSWREISPLLGLKTPAGSWKRFNKLLAQARKKSGYSMGGTRGKDAC